jgi:hypothetical protein
MEVRLGDVVGEPYRQGAAGRFAKLAKTCTAAGGAVIATAGRRRPAAIAGSTLLLCGSLFQRMAVYEAGAQSANDPRATVQPQRERIARDGGRATTRPSGART